MSFQTTSEWDDLVGTPGPVLVYFQAPWSSLCRTLESRLNALADHFRARVSLVAINADECPELCERLGVTLVPTLLLFSRGQELARFHGDLHEGELIRALYLALGF
jgi:thioredoxin 1